MILLPNMDPSIEDLKNACAQLPYHPSVEWLHEAAAAVTSFVINDYVLLGESSVGHTAGRATMKALLGQSPPEEGEDIAQVLGEIQSKIVPYSMRLNHPRFFAFIPAAPTFASMLGDWLCAGLNVFAGVWKEAPAAAEVEIQVLD